MAGERVILPEWIKEGGGAASGTEFPRQTATPAERPVSRTESSALIESIVAVCRAHNLWIAHEDAYGAFIVQRKSTEEWLCETEQHYHDRRSLPE